MTKANDKRFVRGVVCPILSTGVVLVPLYSTVLYHLIGFVEHLVMRRFGAVPA